ncbi:hypothetical protein FRAAL2643 [Frankia alni ACN14a]|uniref:Uncharacterized protein n=1 Tax=Frankia alni (strain DSM 45986 / CECT 9034 / ACN14a) TaxID=326424 RepID=Q0RMG2_FRAAA|nr:MULTISPECIES: hypothetical protein [Frankia]CAJ61289.1 hypothetical protein FRAAL2643 [Frankia alni ACN14a]
MENEVPKKPQRTSPRIIVSDRFEFIDAEYATRTTANARTPAPSIIQMYAWLDVSRSGFYVWRDRPAAVSLPRLSSGRSPSAGASA